MSLTKGEAAHIDVLVRYLLGEAVPAEHARRAAHILASRANLVHDRTPDGPEMLRRWHPHSPPPLVDDQVLLRAGPLRAVQ